MEEGLIEGNDGVTLQHNRPLLSFSHSPSTTSSHSQLCLFYYEIFNAMKKKRGGKR